MEVETDPEASEAGTLETGVVFGIGGIDEEGTSAEVDEVFETSDECGLFVSDCVPDDEDNDTADAELVGEETSTGVEAAPVVSLEDNTHVVDAAEGVLASVDTDTVDDGFVGKDVATEVEADPVVLSEE